MRGLNKILLFSYFSPFSGDESWKFGHAFDFFVIIILSFYSCQTIFGQMESTCYSIQSSHWSRPKMVFRNNSTWFY